MNDIYESLMKAVMDCDKQAAAKWGKKAVEEDVDLLEAIAALTEAIRQVGDGFGRGELFLPELIGAAAAMTAAMSFIDERIKATGKDIKSQGTIVAGTVAGDIHNIGKDMIVTLARADGFTVIDLGVDVNNERFLEAVKEHTPDIVAMSALLTTTAMEQEAVIKTLEEGGVRDKVKVVVGGSAITKEFAEKIGADGYRATAPMGVKLFNELLS